MRFGYFSDGLVPFFYCKQSLSRQEVRTLDPYGSSDALTLVGNLFVPNILRVRCRIIPQFNRIHKSLRFSVHFQTYGRSTIRCFLASGRAHRQHSLASLRNFLPGWRSAKWCHERETDAPCVLRLKHRLHCDIHLLIALPDTIVEQNVFTAWPDTPLSQPHAATIRYTTAHSIRGSAALGRDALSRGRHVAVSNVSRKGCKCILFDARS